MGGLCKLMRHLDYWHAGKKPTMVVRIQADGQALDDSTNKLAIGLPQWKGMAGMIASSPSKPLQIITMPSEMFTDGLGHVRRFVYEVDVQNNETIRFKCIRPYDD